MLGKETKLKLELRLQICQVSYFVLKYLTAAFIL